MRDGDIYRWKWADEDKRDLGSWGAYHCYSQWAVVRDGKLRDTYWSTEEKVLSPDEVALTFVANAEDLAELMPYDLPYYRSEDIVDMRHSNNSLGPIYLRKGAEKNAEAMMEVVRSRREEAERSIRFANDQISRCDDMATLIEDGRLDEVYL